MEKPTVRKTEYKPHTYYDYSLLFITLILVCIGLVMVYSTSSYYAVKQKFGDAAYFFNRQLIAAVLGAVVMVVVSKIDYMTYVRGIGKKYKFRLLFLAYALCIGLQIYVLFFGEEVKGAKRWIKIPFIGTFQPSELTKICVILLVAYIVYAAPKQLDTVFGFIRVILYVCPLLALVAAENLSTAIIIAGILTISRGEKND